MEQSASWVAFWSAIAGGLIVSIGNVLIQSYLKSRDTKNLNKQLRVEALHAIDEASAVIVELQQIHARIMQTNDHMLEIFSALERGAVDLANTAANSGSSSDALMKATKNMQEMQMSLNLQYLNLQNSMQNENRQFSMVSNIMKTKHDTVKNSISNIR